LLSPFLQRRCLPGGSADGLPVHNAHGGYDLQGVQAAAQRHDGTMTLHWADGWFTLRILLPVPEK